MSIFRLWDRYSRNNVDVATVPQEDGSVVFRSQTGIRANVIQITPTLDTNIYASGDVLCETVEIQDAVGAIGSSALLHSLTILDKDDQAGAFDVVFLSSDVDLGTLNDVVSISDADAMNILGVISITADDYIDFVGSQLVTKTLVGLTLKANVASTSIYMALISRDTKTYSASGLVFKLGLAQD